MITLVSYPAERGTFSQAELTAVLQTVGLPALAKRLSDEAHWNQILSLGGHAVSSANSLRSALVPHHPGDRVALQDPSVQDPSVQK